MYELGWVGVVVLVLIWLLCDCLGCLVFGLSVCWVRWLIRLFGLIDEGFFGQSFYLNPQRGLSLVQRVSASQRF